MILIGSLLSTFFLFVYFFGISPTVFGGDSGDIILSYFFAGVPHPPGYPLNTMLGWLFTRIPFGDSFAFKANFVSSLYMAIAVGLSFILLFKLTRNYFASLVGSLILGFIPLFWLYAHIAEVFQLNLLLILLSLVFLADLLQSKKSFSFKSVYLSVFFLGLSIFHHQTSALLLPAYLFVFWINRGHFLKNRKNIVLAVVVFFAGAMPYLFVPFAALRKTPLNWGDPSSIGNLIKLIMRADYGTFSASPDLVGFTLKARMLQLVWYFRIVKVDFTVLGILLALAGTVLLFFKNRILFWFLLLCLFFSGPFFLFYASFPLTNPFLQGVSERFVILSYLFITIFLTFGFIAVEQTLVRFFAILPLRRESLRLLILLSFLLFPLALAIVNWPKTDLSKYSIGSDLSRDILISADPPGMIFLQGDTPSFNTEYVYFAEKVNPQAEILLTGRLRFASYRDDVKRIYPDIVFDGKIEDKNTYTVGFIVSLLIEKNIDRVPIYSLFSMPISSEYKLVREGMLYRIYRAKDIPSDEQILVDIQRKFDLISITKKKISPGYRQFLELNIINTYADILASNGYEMLNRNNQDQSRSYFEQSLSLQNDNHLALRGLAEYYEMLEKCDKSKSYYLKLVSLDDKDEENYLGLSKLYQDCYADSTSADKYKKLFEELKSTNLKSLD